MRHNLKGDFIICDRCKKAVYTPDFYAQNARKYCKECAKLTEKENNLKRVHEYRERAKQKRQQQAEENKLLHDINNGLKEELRLLQRLIQMQREQLDSYENPDYIPATSEEIRNKGITVIDYYKHRKDLKK